MVTVLEAVPVERITAQAQRTAATVSPGRMLLALLTGLFFAIGWLAAKAWFAVVWMGTAVKVGWTTAHEQHQSRTGPSGPAR